MLCCIARVLTVVGSARPTVVLRPAPFLVCNISTRSTDEPTSFTGHRVHTYSSRCVFTTQLVHVLWLQEYRCSTLAMHFLFNLFLFVLFLAPYFLNFQFWPRAADYAGYSSVFERTLKVTLSCSILTKWRFWQLPYLLCHEAF